MKFQYELFCGYQKNQFTEQSNELKVTVSEHKQSLVSIQISKKELVVLVSVCTYKLHRCYHTQLKAHKKVMLITIFNSFTKICHVNEWKQELHFFLLQWFQSGAPSMKLAGLHSCETTRRL